MPATAKRVSLCKFRPWATGRGVFTVFHFSSLFTLFTTTQALFLLCLLVSISQRFTGDSLIPAAH